MEVSCLLLAVLVTIIIYLLGETPNCTGFSNELVPSGKDDRMVVEGYRTQMLFKGTNL